MQGKFLLTYSTVFVSATFPSLFYQKSLFQNLIKVYHGQSLKVLHLCKAIVNVYLLLNNLQSHIWSTYKVILFKYPKKNQIVQRQFLSLQKSFNKQ